MKNVSLTTGYAQTVTNDVEQFKKSGIKQSVPGTTDNYKGVKQTEECTFDSVDGIWKLDSATPNNANQTIDYSFSFVRAGKQ